MVKIGYSGGAIPVAMGTAFCPVCERETIMVKKVKKYAFVIGEIPLIPLYYSRSNICLRCGRNLPYSRFSKKLTKQFLKLDFPEEPSLEKEISEMAKGSYPVPAVSLCPRCGAITQYSSEENDHYCWNCEEYVGDMG